MPTFEQGETYAAAIDWPWLLLESTGVGAVEGEGWDVRELVDCEEGMVTPMDTPPPPGCGTTYNKLGVATRTGPTYERELPGQFVWVSNVEGGEPVAARPEGCREPLAFWTGALLGFGAGALATGLAAVAWTAWQGR